MSIRSKSLAGVVALFIALFVITATNQPVGAQDRANSPHGEMKNPKPAGKKCYVYEGKKYCLEVKQAAKSAKEDNGGSPGKLKAAPKPTRAPKDCYWYNGKLYCITYGITSGDQ